jgi:hypothetical protein
MREADSSGSEKAKWKMHAAGLIFHELRITIHDSQFTIQVSASRITNHASLLLPSSAAAASPN